jgi:hypothetical protein
VRAHHVISSARESDAFTVELKRFAAELIVDQFDRAASNEFPVGRRDELRVLNIVVDDKA